MKILFVCNEFPPTIHGGIGVFVYSLTQVLTQKGISCYVIGFDPDINETQTSNEKEIQVTRLRSPYKARFTYKLGRFRFSTKFILDRIYLSRQVNKLIKRESIDLVESYDWGGPLWKKPVVPLIVRMHGSNSALQKFEGRHISKLIKFFELRNLLMANQLISVSRHIGDITMKAFQIKNREYKVIYNGVDTQLFCPAEGNRDQNIILFAGSINRRKGIFELFQAFNLINQVKPEVKLIVAGKLPIGKNCEKIKSELLQLLNIDFRKNVDFLGQIPYHKMPDLYRRATMAIFPSHAEAFGFTCVEAMACETPVIMTNKASGQEIVEPDVSGKLIDPTSPKEIADVAIQLLDNPSLRNRLGKMGRKRILTVFDRDQISVQNLQLYQEVLSKNAIQNG